VVVLRADGAGQRGAIRDCDTRGVDDTPAEESPTGFGGSAGEFAEMARRLSARSTVQETLQRIVDFATANVEGCDGAGVLLVHKNEIVTGAWSNELVRQIETMEYELGEGPCVDAIWQRPVFESADLRENAHQWPTFVPRALEAGIEPMLGFSCSSPKTPSARSTSTATEPARSTKPAARSAPCWPRTRHWRWRVPKSTNKTSTRSPDSKKRWQPET